MRAKGPGGGGPPILGQMLASQGQMLACPDRYPLTLGHGLD